MWTSGLSAAGETEPSPSASAGHQAALDPHQDPSGNFKNDP